VRPGELARVIGSLEGEKIRAALRTVVAEKSIHAHVEYQKDPIGWIVEKLGIPERTLRWSMNPGYVAHQWDGTKDPLVEIGEALAAWQDVAVESGTGTGKSFFVACICLWFLACHPNARVYSYAPKEDQLRLYMWTEIRHLWPRFKALFPTARLTDLRIRMDGESDKWGAFGYSVQIRANEKSATAAQGAHAEHMLLIVEETPGVPPAVMEALENTCTAPHNLRLAVGNPDAQTDPLHQFARSWGVRSVRMSALDHPNVVCQDHSIVPGAVSVMSVERRRNEQGEDSRIFRSRVRGISPEQAVDSLIRREWCMEAVARYSDPQLREGPPALGIDVAQSDNGDLAAVARGRGRCLLEVATEQCPDALQFARNVVAEVRAGYILPEHVGVDSVGVGTNVINVGREEKLRFRALNGGARPEMTLDEELRDDRGIVVVEEGSYRNLRAQMYWYFRRDLERGLIALPDDPELIDDLVEPKWWRKNGKIHLESKEEIKARLGRSPDKGDAAVYWNWIRPRRRQDQEPEEEVVEQYDEDFDVLLEELNARRGKRRAF
jgi:phage terminase large subunit